MGEKTGIAWTDSTFNPWHGCQRVSPGCELCYAETFDARFGEPHWGPKAPRRFFGDKHWNEPLKWNRAAEASGVRRRVFCASMADVFEDRPDLVEHRLRLWKLIEATPHLDWLLLTKRPENIHRMLPKPTVDADGNTRPYFSNVWLGPRSSRRSGQRTGSLICSQTPRWSNSSPPSHCSASSPSRGGWTRSPPIHPTRSRGASPGASLVRAPARRTWTGSDLCASSARSTGPRSSSSRQSPIRIYVSRV